MPSTSDQSRPPHGPLLLSRRQFYAVCASGLAGAVSWRRARRTPAGTVVDALEAPATSPRLTARHRRPTKTVGTGLVQVDLNDPRDVLLYVPQRRDETTGAPLALMLHGATMRAMSQINVLSDVAEELGLVVLSVKSLGITWDGIRGDYGPDIAYLSTALDAVFDRVLIDPARIAVGGFSDGASYGLALALSNGALVTHAIAFSAGFIPPVERQGKPRIFQSHGTKDAILPIDQCGRRVVATLRRAGYDVDYREFDGPHTVPRPIARAAAEWLVSPRPK